MTWYLQSVHHDQKHSLALSRRLPTSRMNFTSGAHREVMLQVDHPVL